MRCLHEENEWTVVIVWFIVFSLCAHWFIFYVLLDTAFSYQTYVEFATDALLWVETYERDVLSDTQMIRTPPLDT